MTWAPFSLRHLYAIEERELILDLFEMASGSRMMCNYFRFGGVAEDLPEEFLPLAKALVYERLPRAIEADWIKYLTKNEILVNRCKGSWGVEGRRRDRLQCGGAGVTRRRHQLRCAETGSLFHI